MKNSKKISGLGDRLRQLRNDRKWTQSDVSDRLGLVRSTYAYYEVEKTSPDHATMVRIARLFGVSTDYLLGNFLQNPILVHDDSAPDYKTDEDKAVPSAPGIVSEAMEARVMTAFRFLKTEDQQRFLAEMETRVVSYGK